MIGPLSYECIVPRYLGIEETMTGMTALQAKEQSQVVVLCQLLRREHCEVGFPKNEQNILELDTDEQDAMPQMNQIERDEIGVLEV